MGSTYSSYAPKSQNGYTSSEYEEHPFLSSILNPINRFYDDFASSLIDDIGSNKENELNVLPDANIQELEGYTIVRCIGSGAEASVYEAIENQTHYSCAIKKYNNVQINDENIPREISIARDLDNPYCLKILHFFKSISGNYIVVLPIADEALTTSNSPQITVIGAITILLHIGTALNYMHSLNIVHRDVKPQNILLFSEIESYVLCDFSISTKLSRSDEKVISKVGTSYFMAPEIGYNKEYSPKPADMWALGISVYWLLYGTLPFNLLENITQDNHVNKIAFETELQFPPIPIVPNELKRIISHLLDKNCQTRMTATQLISDPFLINKYQSYQEALNFLKNGTI